MQLISDGSVFQSSQERYFAKCSRYFYWFLIITAAANGIANLYVWLTPAVEVIPPFVRGIAACLGLFNLCLYVVLVGGGLIRLRGSTNALQMTDHWRIVVFALITIAPFFIWAFRGSLAKSPISQDSLTGWVAAFQLSTLFAGIVVASERLIGLDRATAVQDLSSRIYDKIALPFSAVRFVHAVLLGAWETEPKNRFAKIDKIDAGNLRNARSGVYADAELLGYFQDTVLTKYYEPIKVAKTAQFKTFARKSGKAIRILDIGGGEGVATANLIDRLIEHRGSEFGDICIDLFEGEELSTRYVECMNQKFDGNVNVSTKGLFRLESEISRYDLIVLFHSLYALVDASRTQVGMESEILSIKTKLLGCLLPDGLIVGSVASQHGVSATLKRKCMMEAFGRTIQDVTFEELIETWKPNSHLIVDGFFKFVGDENGRIARNLGNAWLRYFARMTEDWLNIPQERFLFQHLVIRCCAFEDLNETSRREIIEIDPLHEERLDRTQFLPHKTGIFLTSAS